MFVTAYLDTDTKKYLLRSFGRPTIKHGNCNGGLRRARSALVFNLTVLRRNVTCWRLPTSTYARLMNETDWSVDSSDDAAANVSHCAFAECTYESLSVTALVTAVSIITAGRGETLARSTVQQASRTSKLWEQSISSCNQCGTLRRNDELRLSCVRAKNAALQELHGRSAFSHGLLPDRERSDLFLLRTLIRLYWTCGKHTNSRIDRRVWFKAVKEALIWNGAECRTQFRVLSRLKRTGCRRKVWCAASMQIGKLRKRYPLKKAVDEVDQPTRLVAILLCLCFCWIRQVGSLPFQCASVSLRKWWNRFAQNVCTCGAKFVSGRFAENLAVCMDDTGFYKKYDQTWKILKRPLTSKLQQLKKHGQSISYDSIREQWTSEFLQNNYSEIYEAFTWWIPKKISFLEQSAKIWADTRWGSGRRYCLIRFWITLTRKGIIFVWTDAISKARCRMVWCGICAFICTTKKDTAFRSASVRFRFMKTELLSVPSKCFRMTRQIVKCWKVWKIFAILH